MRQPLSGWGNARIPKTEVNGPCSILTPTALPSALIFLYMPSRPSHHATSSFCTLFIPSARLSAMIAYFIALALLSAPQPVRSTGITLSLFTDEHCSAASTTNPSASLGINVCVVTPGLESFIYTPVACTTGFAKAWVFADAGCAKPIEPDYYYAGSNANDYCYEAYIPGVFPALMLTCDADADEDTPSRPTSTTTLVVGPVVDAATSTAAGASTGGSTATGASSAGSTTSSSSTSTNSGSGSGTGTSTSHSNASGWNSLDYGSRVAIIVAIAVGVPPILIGLYALKRSGRIG